MKQLEIFKENLKFTQWGELYAGIKMNWITTSDVLFFCENQLINNVDEDVYVDLYLSLEESLFCFLEKLKELTAKEGEPIIKNEDEKTDYGFFYIPSQYFRIWELEFLLRIRNKEASEIDKISEITDLFDFMNYPEPWKDFYLFSNHEKNRSDSISTGYMRFLKYVQNEIMYFKNYNQSKL